MTAACFTAVALGTLRLTLAPLFLLVMEEHRERAFESRGKASVPLVQSGGESGTRVRGPIMPRACDEAHPIPLREALEGLLTGVVREPR